MIPVNLEFLLHAPQPLLSMGVPTIKDQFWIPELIIKYHQSHARASFTDPLVLWDFDKFFPAREIFSEMIQLISGLTTGPFVGVNMASLCPSPTKSTLQISGFLGSSMKSSFINFDGQRLC